VHPEAREGNGDEQGEGDEREELLCQEAPEAERRGAEHLTDADLFTALFGHIGGHAEEAETADADGEEGEEEGEAADADFVPEFSCILLVDEFVFDGIEWFVAGIDGLDAGEGLCHGEVWCDAQDDGPAALIAGDVKDLGAGLLVGRLIEEIADDADDMIGFVAPLDDLAEWASTPLGWAARHGQKEMVRWLVARGADVSAPADRPWARPIEWARRGGDMEMVELLNGR